jgi:hypothetical protein
LDAAAAFGTVIRRRQPFIGNDKRIFGAQVYMDSEDGVLGEEPQLLVTATDIGVGDVAALTERFGGVAWPAHIDRPAFSLLSNLGFWDDDLGFRLAECDRNCPADFISRYPGLAGVPILTGSDAHCLDQIAEAACAMEVPDAAPGAVLDWLRRHGKGPRHKNNS